MHKTLIIAEAGINANGIFENAKLLADAAKEAGADCVKYQAYFGSQPGFEKYEFTKAQWTELADYCEAIGIEFMSTPFDREAIEFLESVGMERWKIPSGMLTNREFLGMICPLPNKILSTGMGTIEEIKSALRILDSLPPANIDRTALLHCTTAYPCPLNEVNLLAIHTLKMEFIGRRIGFSDHSPSLIVPAVAIGIGATIIEKHLTLFRSSEGPDHKASLNPQSFKRMVRSIRRIEIALGDFNKEPTPSELLVRDDIRKRMGCN